MRALLRAGSVSAAAEELRASSAAAYSGSTGAAGIAVSVRVEIAGRMARVVVVLAGSLLLSARVAVSFGIKIAGRVARMIMVLAWHLLLPALVAVAVRVEVTGRMAGMVMVLAGFFVGHIHSPQSYFGRNARGADWVPSPGEVSR